MGVWGHRPQRVQGGVAKGSNWPASANWTGHGGNALAFLYQLPTKPTRPASMRARGLWLLAAACSVIVMLEWAHASIRATPASGVAGAPSALLSHGQRGTMPGLREKPVDSAGAILARPLFAPSRRPPAPAAATDPAAIAEPPRLTGVIVAPSTRRAIFAATKGRATVVSEGGSIGGYLVKSIDPSGAVLSGPMGEHVLRTTYAKRNFLIRPHVLQAQTENSAR
jgi:hypothetical protein